MKLSNKFVCNGWTLTLFVLAVIFNISCATTVKQPKIFILRNEEKVLHDQDSEYLVQVNASTTLELICETDEPIHWKLSDSQNKDERLSIKQLEKDSQNYTTILTIKNISQKDALQFDCSYNSTEVPEGYYDAYVIIHVRDEHLLMNEDEQIIHLPLSKGSEGIIPCRPTSPDVTIELYKESTRISLDSNYDPQVGYIINPVTSVSEGHYNCIGTRGEIEEQLLIVAFLAPPAGESLGLPRINATDDGIVTVGSSFILDCATEQELRIFYSLNWTEPAGVINSGRAKIELEELKNNNHMKSYVSRLTINDARIEDQGDYKCTIWYDGTSKNVTKTIKVFDDSVRYINATTDGTNITIMRSSPAQWAITVSTFPSPTDFYFEWKRGDGRKIVNSQKHYTEQKSGSRVILKIFNATLEDAGAYSFIVTNKLRPELKKELKLYLFVYDSPNVKILPMKPNTYFLADQNYTLLCIASGYPAPSVEWYFSNITSFEEQNCSSFGMKLYNDTEIITENQKTISTITITSNNHGIWKCIAKNGIGGDKCLQKNMKVVDFPGEDGFGIVSPKEFIEQDSVKLTCALSKLFKKPYLEWKKRNEKGEWQFLSNVDGLDGMNILESESEWSWKKDLNIKRINKSHSGKYVCIVDSGEDVMNKTLEIQVKAMEAPKIYETNLNQSEVSYREGEPPSLKLICRVSGIPKPIIEWTKDGVSEREWSKDIQYTTDPEGEELTFSYIRTIASGTYSCTARNRNGTTSTFIKIKVESDNEINPLLGVFLIGTIIAVIVLLACLARKIHKDRVMKRYLNEIRKKEFEEGAVGDINPELGIEDQANLLPYDRQWEFPRCKLKLGMQLGSGAFGRVMKGEAEEIVPGEKRTTVAVKMVKANADETHIKALMSELKIMVHLGQHVNVVNLLGACTEHLVKKKELLVIVEYCKYGSLLSYMHSHGSTFVNQLDPVSGKIDTNIYNPINRSSQQSQAPKLNYAALTFTDTGNNRKPASNGYRTLEELSEEGSPISALPVVFDNTSTLVQHLHPMDPRRRGSVTTDYYGQGSNGESMCTDMSYLSNTAGAGEINRRSSVASCQEHYRGDYQHVEVRPIKTTDLLCWSFQIARGMDYLSSRKVLHGDLAARNVLLAENNVVKICDFGLAKEMYKDYKYKKKTEGGLLPVKWMAIESIYFRVFSTQSDVWSFGVVLWELFTLGKSPYPGMEADDRFYKAISEGYRMEKPPLAPCSIYDLMMECWAHESSARPVFPALVDRIGDMMDEGLRQHYLDLNLHYDKINQEWLSSKHDYLSEMSAPDFQSVSCRPSPERQYENVLQMADSGYLLPIVGNKPVEYINVIHQNQTIYEPSQLLANNTGYMMMNYGSDTNLTNGLKSEHLNSSEKSESNIPSLKDSNEIVSQIQRNTDETHLPSTTMPVISSSNYIPNNIFPPLLNGDAKDLDKLAREAKTLILQKKNENDEGTNDSSVDLGSSSSSKRYRGKGRQKNDSGLGSIDSSHFEGNGKSAESSYKAESPTTLEPNFGYTSHSTPFELQSNDNIPKTNGIIKLPNTHYVLSGNLV